LTTIFFVAGETSGDAHGAGLIQALREKCPDVHYEGLGGEMMATAGMNLRYDLAGLGIMGFTEVIKHFFPIKKLFDETVRYLGNTRPDCLVLIDYPGFNIRLAKAVASYNIPVVYYISPQVWAWKKKRIYTLARYVTKMLVIFPFEADLYKNVGLNTVYVGHPLLDHISNYQPNPFQVTGKLIGLLPGSREQEVRRLMPIMLETAKQMLKKEPDLQFITPCVNAARAEQIKKMAGDFPLEVRVNAMYDVLSQAHFCMVASGTATLETLMFGVPMLIMYKVTTISYWLARALVDIKYIGIVNILAGKEIVPEFIQSRASTEHILPTALKLLQETPERKQMLLDLESVRMALGDGGASGRAAEEILHIVQGNACG